MKKLITNNKKVKLKNINIIINNRTIILLINKAIKIMKIKLQKSKIHNTPTQKTMFHHIISINIPTHQSWNSKNRTSLPPKIKIPKFRNGKKNLIGLLNLNTPITKKITNHTTNRKLNPFKNQSDSLN